MTFEKSVVVPLDPDATFDLITQPERLRRWMAVAARVELRPGGDYRWTVTPGHTAAGTIVDVEPVRWFAPELLREVFDVFERHQHSLDLLSASRGSLALLVSSVTALPPGSVVHAPVA